MVALLVVEDFEEGFGEAGADLGGRASEVDEAVGAVVEDGDGSPALRFGFSLEEHGLDPPWPGCEYEVG